MCELVIFLIPYFLRPDFVRSYNVISANPPAPLSTGCVTVYLCLIYIRADCPSCALFVIVLIFNLIICWSYFVFLTNSVVFLVRI